MKIALIQMEIIDGNVKLNVEKAISLIKKAVSLGAKIVALPELWTTGYDLKNIITLSTSKENLKALLLLQNFARSNDIYIVGGSIATNIGGYLYNRAYLISNNGSIVATYDKLHLIPLFKEDLYFSPGKKLCSYDLSNIKCGILICYDLRFPELARDLTIKKGCNILFIPSEWPSIRGEHWLVLNRARAIENQLYICAINRVGTNENINFFGNSLIIDPYGDIIARGPKNNEEVIVENIEISKVEEARETIPSLKGIRMELYK